LQAVPEIFHQRLLEAYHRYLMIGGMPECVHEWLTSHDPQRVEKLQRDLLSLYENDFAKHNKKVDAGRILLAYRSIVPQLSRENKKFTYGLIKRGARAREFEIALAWLCSSGILNRIANVTKPMHPLPAYEKEGFFKLYFFDTGLLKCAAGVANAAILLGKDYQFKGALAENFVQQQWQGRLQVPLHYFAPDSIHEIDFLLQDERGEVIPIEVKAGSSNKAASFKSYLAKYQPHTAIRYSEMPLKKDGAFVNLPIYMAGLGIETFC